MADQLATGTLGDLIRAMPPNLRQRLNEEIAEQDRIRFAAHKAGKPKVIALANHLRWMVQHEPELGLMKTQLYGLLVKYLPISLDQMLDNQLPTLSDCSYFWGLKIKELERVSTKINSIPV